MQLRPQRHVLYFHPDSGRWTREETGATMRLVGRLRVAVMPEVENQIEQRVDGDWRPVDADTLTGVETGYGWLLCPTMRAGVSLAELRSVRLPTPEIARRLLAGLEPLDLEGVPLPDVALAGTRFLLSEPEGRTFVKRAKADGAFIWKAELDLLGARQALSRGEDAAALLADSVAADEAIITNATARGAYSQMTMLAQREDAWRAQQRVTQAMADAEQALAGLVSRGSSSAEQVEAAKIVQRLEQLQAQAQALIAEHSSQLRRAARLLASRDPGTIAPHGPAQQRGLYSAVAEHLARTGQASHLSPEDELVIVLADGRRIMLGERVRIEEASETD